MPQPGQVSLSESATISEQARQLMQPSELLGMGDDQMIVFADNCYPIQARKHPYFSRAGRALLSTRRLGLLAGIQAVALLLISLVFAFAVYGFATGALRPDGFTPDHATIPGF